MESAKPWRYFICEMLLLTQMSFGIELHEDSEGNVWPFVGRNYFRNLMDVVLYNSVGLYLSMIIWI